jgi:hypothetical protein
MARLPISPLLAMQDLSQEIIKYNKQKSTSTEFVHNIRFRQRGRHLGIIFILVWSAFGSYYRQLLIIRHRRQTIIFVDIYILYLSLHQLRISTNYALGL